jgi:hypothetical protein
MAWEACRVVTVRVSSLTVMRFFRMASSSASVDFAVTSSTLVILLSSIAGMLTLIPNGQTEPRQKERREPKQALATASQVSSAIQPSTAWALWTSSALKAMAVRPRLRAVSKPPTVPECSALGHTLGPALTPTATRLMRELPRQAWRTAAAQVERPAISVSDVPVLLLADCEGRITGTTG